MTLSLLWRLLFWGWLVSEIIIALATRTRRGSGNVRDQGSMIVLWVVIAAAMTACGWIEDAKPAASMFGEAHWLKAASVGVMAAGLGIRWAAIANLGSAFSANVAIRDAQKLRRTGLYRFVRHPSYLGLLIIFLAVGLHSRNWLGLSVALVPPTVALLYRIRIEEAALSEAFGGEYAAYTKSTKRLIPGVY